MWHFARQYLFKTQVFNSSTLPELFNNKRIIIITLSNNSFIILFSLNPIHPFFILIDFQNSFKYTEKLSKKYRMLPYTLFCLINGDNCFVGLFELHNITYFKYVTLFHITFFWSEPMLILLPVIVRVRFLHMFQNFNFFADVDM